MMLRNFQPEDSPLMKDIKKGKTGEDHDFHRFRQESSDQKE